MSEQTLPPDPTEIPPELDRWNWGAFLLNWIWGIGNNTFIALLVFVPLLGLVMPFVLGAKGSRWAWRNGHWEGVDHFKRVQRAWAKWAVILYCGVIVLFGAIFGGTFYLLKNSEAYKLAVSKLETSTEVTTALGSPIRAGFPSGKISTNGTTGDASLSFSVSGPKGSGTAYLAATKKDGAWTLFMLKLKIEGQDQLIDLLHPPRAEIIQRFWLAEGWDRWVGSKH